MPKIKRVKKGKIGLCLMDRVAQNEIFSYFRNQKRINHGIDHPLRSPPSKK